MPLLILFIYLFLTCEAGAQTTVNGSFVHGGITRTYSFYVPASYNPSRPAPLVFNLHGLGKDGADQAENRDFRPIADTAGFIVVHPDGSIQPLIQQRFWNYGSVAGSTVDDVGFIERIIDTISAHYTINQKRIYSAGMSNGGFMSYYLACQSNRFAAVGSVTGSMSADMYESCNPSHPTPTIHIHGTSDPLNPYNGSSTSKSIQAVTQFWVNQNGCTATPVVTRVPNSNTADNVTADRFVYSGGVNGHTVEHWRVNGGGHTWPGIKIFTLLGRTCMDFNAGLEMWRFFRQYELSTATIPANPVTATLNIWPNPSSGVITLQPGDRAVSDIIITDMQGRVRERRTGSAILRLDLTHLEPGVYMGHFSGEGFQEVKKLVIL